VASNYVSNPAATQAPSAAPGPNVLPTVSLIQDADGNTAANLYQAWKVLCDFIGYLMQIIGGTTTAKSIMVDAVGGTSVTGTAGVVQARGLAVSNTTAAIAPGIAHLGFQGATPTFLASTGAGTGPTIVMSTGSSDTRGLISVTTGTAPAGSNAFIVAVNFANALGTNLNGALCLLTPANAAAAALSGTTQVFTTVNSNSGTQFSIISGSAALTASTQYAWNYFMVG
jgi:hypothetical protein